MQSIEARQKKQTHGNLKGTLTVRLCLYGKLSKSKYDDSKIATKQEVQALFNI